MDHTATATTLAGYDYRAAGAGASSYDITEDATELASASETVASVTYTEDAIEELLFMIEEEKLAGDVYDLFYDLYGLQVFDNIATSEDRHFDALIRQAEALGLDVSTYLEEDAGTFENEDLQALYDELIFIGSQSLTDALEVGLLIEEKDMVDIADAIEEVEDTALAEVYQNLLDGSANHLDAFEFLLVA